MEEAMSEPISDEGARGTNREQYSGRDASGSGERGRGGYEDAADGRKGRYDSRGSDDTRRRRRRSREGRHSRSRSRSRSPRRDRGYENRSSSSKRENRSERPRRERKKRKSGWDVAPKGYEGMSVTQVANINPSVLMPMMGHTHPQQNRQARRLYVGNVPQQVTEGEMEDFFKTAMIHSNLTTLPGNPLVNTMLNQQKAYAFLEFRNEEEASACLRFDGIMLHGQALKVRRPKDFVQSQGGNSRELQHEKGSLPGIVSTNVEDSVNKVFVGGIPSDLGEKDVRELLSAFGQLKSFNLVKDRETGNSRGYAFCEYLDPSVTENACAGLNNLKLGEKTLVVQPASMGKAFPGSSATENQAGQVAIDPEMRGNESYMKQMLLNFNTNVSALADKALISAELSPVLCIWNAVFDADIVDRDFFEFKKNDILSEMEKFGTIVEFIVPMPEIGESRAAAPEGFGKIFIKYAAVQNAISAKESTHGRKFFDKTLIVGYYPDSLFSEGKY